MRPHGSIAVLLGRLMTVLIASGVLVTGTVYFYVNYQSVASMVLTEDRIYSDLISGIVARNPKLWRYETIRIEDVFSRIRGSSPYPASWKVLTLDGTVVAEKWGGKAPLSITRSISFYDSGTVVGPSSSPGT